METYPYGQNQRLERLEYRSLNEIDRNVYMGMVSDEFELIFRSVRPSEGDIRVSEENEEGVYRRISPVYTSTPVWFFNTEEKTVEEFEPTVKRTALKIEYAQYTQGVLREEYVMKIEQNDRATNGTFSTRYHFMQYAPGVWQADVEHLDIINDDWNMLRPQNLSKFYRRDMTPYDFDEFFKDTTEIKSQLGINLVQ